MPEETDTEVGEATSKFLTPFMSQGVVFHSLEGTRVSADCPSCARGGGNRFVVYPKDGQFNCVLCGFKGNSPVQFLQRYWQECRLQTKREDYEVLAQTRRLLDWQTARDWGAAKSLLLTNTWLLPGYDVKGNVCQLYRYVRGKDGKYLLKATQDLPHGYFRPVEFDKDAGAFYICEGPWDGMAFWEVGKQAKENEDGEYERTSDRALTILQDAEVLAVPGATTFLPAWRSLPADKTAALMYDSDHPRVLCGKCKPAVSWQISKGEKCPKCGADPLPRVHRVGYDGMRRTANVLAAAPQPPAELHYLDWAGDVTAEEQRGYDKTQASGYDVRDFLTGGGAVAADLDDRLRLLKELLDKVKPVPAEWVAGRKKTDPPGLLQIKPEECRDYATLKRAWQEALKWTPELDRALSVILAAVFSTPTVGEQLWVIVMAPPSSAKTILCEAVSLNKTYTHPIDTFTGLTSGYQADKEGSENKSLVLKLHNRTLVLNDGDTLLRLPNREQVLSQLRAFYSRNLRTSYGNEMSAAHEGINCTILLAGTSSLLELDAAELGARFIFCDLGMLPPELEGAIGWRAANAGWNDMEFISDGKPDSRDSEELVRAKQLTAGYVDHLRADPVSLIKEVTITEDRLRYLQSLGEFVSHLRCRPPKKQEEKVEREMPFRLIKQYARLARCLAVVRNKREIDDEILVMVRQTAVDTAQGVTFEIAQKLHEVGSRGLPAEALCHSTYLSADKTRKLLQFLRRKSIGVLQVYTADPQKGERVGKPRWRLTPRMAELWQFVFPAVRAAKPKPKRKGRGR